MMSRTEEFYLEPYDSGLSVIIPIDTKWEDAPEAMYT